MKYRHAHVAEEKKLRQVHAVAVAEKASESVLIFLHISSFSESCWRWKMMVR